MKHLILATTVAALASLSLPTFATGDNDRAAHYQAERSDSTEQAVSNLRSSNQQLAALIGGELSDNDMHDIHKLSYTLEDTLQRLIDDLQLLHDTVADMHWATESMQADAVTDYGAAYLEGIGKIIE
ncbi:MAG: hypothetical protein EA348_07465 [Pseudomonadaceae bacterium]|nr:MAG: hypothetical protein EA348_07465 [Pseudomonadaceae bacterium]